MRALFICADCDQIAPTIAHPVSSFLDDLLDSNKGINGVKRSKPECDRGRTRRSPQGEADRGCRRPACRCPSFRSRFTSQKSDEAWLAKMRTAIGLWERTESASVEPRFVPMADGQVCWCELAFLLTTQRKLDDQRAGALSSSSRESRIAIGRTRAQKPGVRVRSSRIVHCKCSWPIS
jgi:hypothetical protein